MSQGKNTLVTVVHGLEYPDESFEVQMDPDDFTGEDLSDIQNMVCGLPLKNTLKNWFDLALEYPQDKTWRDKYIAHVIAMVF